IAPDATVGYRGSLARGTKGPHKGNAPFDPTSFDVDAFIVSDSLSREVPANRRNFRSARRDSRLVGIQNAIDRELRGKFAGLRDEPFTFRIFSTEEYRRINAPGETHEC